MIPGELLQLVGLSLTRPREAAERLLAARLPREALVLCFALVVVLNTLVFSLSILTSPMAGAMGSVLGNPIAFGALLAVSLMLAIGAVTVVGRLMGGQARLEEIAVLVIWLQVLRVLVQVAVTFLSPVSIFLSGLLVMAASVFGIWIFINFLDVAERFGSLAKSFFAALFAALGIILALSLLLSLVGVSTSGLPGYV